VLFTSSTISNSKFFVHRRTTGGLTPDEDVLAPDVLAPDADVLAPDVLAPHEDEMAPGGSGSTIVVANLMQGQRS
jgi:hypothetical protein